MILKVMTDDGYSLYPGIKRVDFFSAAAANPRVWYVAPPGDNLAADSVFARIGESDELTAHPVNFFACRTQREGKRSICLLSGEYQISDSGDHSFFSWAFDEAYLMDDSGKTIEHLY